MPKCMETLASRVISRLKAIMRVALAKTRNKDGGVTKDLAKVLISIIVNGMLFGMNAPLPIIRRHSGLQFNSHIYPRERPNATIRPKFFKISMETSLPAKGSINLKLSGKKASKAAVSRLKDNIKDIGPRKGGLGNISSATASVLTCKLKISSIVLNRVEGRKGV